VLPLTEGGQAVAEVEVVRPFKLWAHMRGDSPELLYSLSDKSWIGQVGAGIDEDPAYVDGAEDRIRDPPACSPSVSHRIPCLAQSETVGRKGQ
jgi:hypothetical protein